MYTRKQRLSDDCTHREYYAQFVTNITKQRVLRTIGNKERLKEHFKLESEEFFHPDKIQIKTWDKFSVISTEADKMREAGDYLTLSGIVCIAKEAAKQIVEEA